PQTSSQPEQIIEEAKPLEQQPIVAEQEKPQVIKEEEKSIDVVEDQKQKVPESPKKDVPVHEVNEDDTVTLTVDRPKGKDVAVILLKDGERLEQNDHIKITSKSPTTTEITILKSKPQSDEGDYSVIINDSEQPLMRLVVHPKPVQHQTMDLPKTLLSNSINTSHPITREKRLFSTKQTHTMRTRLKPFNK
ncbi:unnamed protein product, partial [Didymodactylos carnosus]